MSIQVLTTKYAVLIAAFVAAPWAVADAPPGPYFNGFETDTAGWFNNSGATITRVPSGSSSTYANEVAAATGGSSFHWRSAPLGRTVILTLFFALSWFC